MRLRAVALLAFWFVGCASIQHGSVCMPEDGERTFMSWLIQDLHESNQIQGYSSLSVNHQTSNYPLPSHIDLEGFHQGLLRDMSQNGTAFVEAIEDYWQSNLSPSRIQEVMDVPDDCLVVRKIGAGPIVPAVESMDSSVSVEDWRVSKPGFLYSVSKPGFSKNGEVAVVYFGVYRNVASGGWGEIRIYEMQNETWAESDVQLKCNWSAYGLIYAEGGETLHNQPLQRTSR